MHAFSITQRLKKRKVVMEEVNLNGDGCLLTGGQDELDFVIIDSSTSLNPSS